MNKIDKAYRSRLDELRERLVDVAAALEKAVNDYNDKVAQAHQEVVAAAERYNEVVEDFQGLRDEVTGDMENYMSDRSDKWQESDAASEYQSWMDEWASAEIEPSDLAEEEPETLEAPVDQTDVIDGLPMERGG